MAAELRRRLEQRWRDAVLAEPPTGWKGGAKALNRKTDSHLAVVFLHHHPGSPPGEQHFTGTAAVLSRVLAEYKDDRLTVEPLADSSRWSWSEPAWRLSSVYPTWFGFDADRDDEETEQALRDVVHADLVPAAEQHMDDAVLLNERWDNMTNLKYLRNLEPGIPFAGNWPMWVEAAVLAKALSRVDIFDRVVAGLTSVSDDRRVSGPGFVDAQLTKLLGLNQR